MRKESETYDFTDFGWNDSMFRQMVEVSDAAIFVLEPIRITDKIRT